MIELFDTLPEVNVQAPEYKRLLGYPREMVLTGRGRELCGWARQWYADHGSAWIYARHAQQLELCDNSLSINGVSFDSPRLQTTLANAAAHDVVLVAVSAGPELEQEAQRLWREEKPDEYFFLETFGSAVVEYLIAATGARLCAWADRHAMAVLPHYSPGYPEWDIAQQPALLNLINSTRENVLEQKIEVLGSGMLRPKKSLLAVFGLTRHTERVRRLTELVPCENCSIPSCQYRRTPYLRAPTFSKPEISNGITGRDAEIETDAETQLFAFPADAKYSVNTKALKRWAEERLTLTRNADATTEAVFRYEGTTCTNMGRALEFYYTLKLGPRERGFPILEQQCRPAPGDTGHTYMCRYMNNAEHLMVAIDREKPLTGQPLNDILAWERPNDLAGCYCELASRKHKWGLVLETIHYALAHQHQD